MFPLYFQVNFWAGICFLDVTFTKVYYIDLNRTKFKSGMYPWIREVLSFIPKETTKYISSFTIGKITSINEVTFPKHGGYRIPEVTMQIRNRRIKRSSYLPSLNTSPKYISQTKAIYMEHTSSSCLYTPPLYFGSSSTYSISNHYFRPLYTYPPNHTFSHPYAARHCEYQSFCLVHFAPDAQTVLPVQVAPPHCP